MAVRNVATKASTQDEVISNLVSQNLSLRKQLKQRDVVLLNEACKYALGAWVSFVQGGNVLVGRVLRVHTVGTEYMYTVLVGQMEIEVGETSLVGTNHLFDVFEDVSFMYGGKRYKGTIKQRIVTMRKVGDITLPKVVYHIRYKDGSNSLVATVSAMDGEIEYLMQ